MAKPFTFETEDKAKEKAFKIIWLTVLIIAIVVSSFVYSTNDGDAYEDATYSNICVHVKGAVNNSGIYYVPWGTRVCDLEAYVGGFKENVLLDGVNLASYVKDGEEIYFPYSGEKGMGALNLNIVTEAELDALVDGIGAGTARKIVEYRNTHGNYTSVVELDDVLGKTKAEKFYKYFYVEK
ncbi:MAG: helix-hairpin-helix domain-containing protein [Clostridia bacterium]|nr:helix-hairpin-helix domain-containing protein [Clostridia bacterium]